MVNGVSIKVPQECNQGRKETMVTGHNYIHCFEENTRVFRTAPQINM